MPPVVGLLLALVGPPLLAFAGRQALGESTDVPRMLPFDWHSGDARGHLALVVKVERQPLASIGLRRPRASTVSWALLLLLGNSFVVVPA